MCFWLSGETDAASHDVSPSKAFRCYSPVVIGTKLRRGARDRRSAAQLSSHFARGRERAAQLEFRKVLGRCELEELTVALEGYGVTIHDNALSLAARSGPSRRGNPLATSDGASISIGPGDAAERVWAIAHLFAHVIQWHCADPRCLHPMFNVGAQESRRLSTQPVHAMRWVRFRRAVDHEMEAHLLTASVLARFCGLVPQEAASVALSKASRDIARLARLTGRGDPRRVVLQGSARRYGRCFTSLPELPPIADVTPRPLSRYYQPYLWLRS
jgi:hypothetical protein